MAAYFVVQATVTDEPRFQKYREVVVPFIARFGGRIVARGAKVEVGNHAPRRTGSLRGPDRTGEGGVFQ